MKSILIVGNGISRLTPDAIKFIEDWDGKMWGCNLIFRDYGDKVDLIVGHIESLEEGERFKEKTGFGFTVLRYQDSELYGTGWSNSGVFLAALAFHRGYNRIIATGMDLGGYDVYSLTNQMFQKGMWVQKWRDLFNKYDHNKFEFLEYDHKPFILSRNKPLNTYAKRFQSGRSHINTLEYIEVLNHFKSEREADPSYTGGKLLDRSKIMMEAIMKWKRKNKNKRVIPTSPDKAAPIEKLGSTGDATIEATGPDAQNPSGDSLIGSDKETKQAAKNKRLLSGR